MSIIIKGMGMPKSCCECDFFIVEDLDVRPYCASTGEDMWWGDSKSGRQPNCPLIELPPHGDLIDKKTVSENLVSALNKKNPPFSYPDWNDAIGAIYITPTIIEAEGKT